MEVEFHIDIGEVRTIEKEYAHATVIGTGQGTLNRLVDNDPTPLTVYSVDDVEYEIEHIILNYDDQEKDVKLDYLDPEDRREIDLMIRSHIREEVRNDI